MRAFPLLVPLVLLAGAAVPAAPSLPRLVFVSRLPARDGRVPGIGPAGRALATGGRLMVREANGRLRALLPEGTFFDVSRPSVSWDGATIAFAATAAPESAWRVWRVGADGHGLAAVTRDAGAGSGARVDDLDPCWLPDGRLCFASTRHRMTDETLGEPVTNLFVIAADGSGMTRITTDRNGAEKPTVDPASGRVVYTRWWFNRWRASAEGGGVTADTTRAIPIAAVDLWQAVSVMPDGDGLRLAGGNPDRREAQAAYAPIVLGDGTLIGVSAANATLVPGPGPATLVAYPGGFGRPRALAGEGRERGTSALAPAALPDGRIVFSLSRGGDFGLWTCDREGRGLARVADLPGRDELDAVALSPRRRPPLAPAARLEPPPATEAVVAESLGAGSHTFRFDCMNVFANGPVDAPFPDAPTLEPGVRIRFYVALARPAVAGGDTVVLWHEAPVSPSGAVHQDGVPADVPMFEQLVDARGRVLRTGNGLAQVPGFNSARFGTGTRCVGCHTGHSALPVPRNGTSAAFVNVANAATVAVSSRLAGSAAPRAAVDRRARGPAGEVGWVADADSGQWLRLSWPWPIEAREVVLYDFTRDPKSGTDPRWTGAELELTLGGRPVRRLELDRPLSAAGTRVGFDAQRLDAMVIRPRGPAGRILGRPRAGLAEVEVIGRLATP